MTHRLGPSQARHLLHPDAAYGDDAEDGRDDRGDVAAAEGTPHLRQFFERQEPVPRDGGAWSADLGDGVGGQNEAQRLSGLGRIKVRGTMDLSQRSVKANVTP